MQSSDNHVESSTQLDQERSKSERELPSGREWTSSISHQNETKPGGYVNLAPAGTIIRTKALVSPAKEVHTPSTIGLNFGLEPTRRKRIFFDENEHDHGIGVKKKKLALDLEEEDKAPKLSFDPENFSSKSENEEEKSEIVEDEVDPLDVFMQEIQEEVEEVGVEDEKLRESNNDNSKDKTSSVEDDFTLQEDDDDVPYLEERDESGEGESDGDNLYQRRIKKKNLPLVDHSKIEYPEFRKDFYMEPLDVSNMSKAEVAAFRTELGNIRVRGRSCPRPIRSWSHCALNDRIYDELLKLGFEKPTPIQAQAIPAIMKGMDVIGCAKTGSGKTMAFILPMFRHILAQPPLEKGDGPIALVISPTRELTLQTYHEANRFGRLLGLRTACVYGGAGVKAQIGLLQSGVEIVICTPGRMIDVLCSNAGRITNLSRATYVVLDEADRMFDMGFEPQVSRIVGNIRPARQTLMFSATFPKQVERLARNILTKPVEITVGEKNAVCDDVEQHVEILENDIAKFRRLLQLLGVWYDKEGNILIFVDTQEDCDYVFRELVRAGYNLLSLHGGMDQADRDSTLLDFKEKFQKMMIATSVAARGLDVANLNLVVNYYCPNHLEDYVHRCGRTGRAGKKGYAYTFLTDEDGRYAADIVQALKESNTEVPRALSELAEKFEGLTPHSSGYGGKGFKFDEAEERARVESRKKELAAAGFDNADEDAPEESDIEQEGEGEVQVEDRALSLAEAGSSEIAQIGAGEQDIRTAEGTTGANTPREGSSTAMGISPTASSENAVKTAAEQAIEQLQGGTSRSGSRGGLAAASAIAAALSVAHQSVDKRPRNVSTNTCEEIEINDYPQHARWKVTQKEAVVAIQEFSGASLTTKGVYVPKGRLAPPGERKLFLSIDGDPESVKRALKEVKRILEETSAAIARDNPDIGRYKVM